VLSRETEYGWHLSGAILGGSRVGGGSKVTYVHLSAYWSRRGESNPGPHHYESLSSVPGMSI